MSHRFERNKITKPYRDKIVRLKGELNELRNYAIGIQMIIDRHYDYNSRVLDHPQVFGESILQEMDNFGRRMTELGYANWKVR
jgi:hypothetical protein